MQGNGPKRHPPFPTAQELRQLIADRANDPNTAEIRLSPPWLLDPEDENRSHIRRRERKINRQTTRLNKATRKMEQEFDQSS